MYFCYSADIDNYLYPIVVCKVKFEQYQGHLWKC